MSDVSIALLALFSLLQVADGVTTTIGLSRGGQELNGIMAWIMDKLGVVPALVVTKAIVIGLVYYMLATVPTAGPYVAAVLCAGYGLIVANNVRVIRGLS